MSALVFVSVLEPESELLYFFVSGHVAESETGEVHVHVNVRAQLVVVKSAFRIANCLGQLQVLTPECVAVVSGLVVLSFGMLQNCVTVVFVLESQPTCDKLRGLCFQISNYVFVVEAYYKSDLIVDLEPRLINSIVK